MLVGVRGSRAAAPKGKKSYRTQGDFCLSCLKKRMRCYRGLTEGLQKPENANQKLQRADLRLKRARFRLERSED